MSYYSQAREYHEHEKFEEAYKLYEQGANAGDEKCFYGIALFFHEGYFVEQNKEKAEKIFAEHFNAILKLAVNDDAEAMIIVAYYYYNGFYVKKNNGICLKWLKKAAKLGNSGALVVLGEWYEIIYLLDEPENSLSIEFQIELAEYISATARATKSQFVIATHSPILLSMQNAKIYNLDAYPADVCSWTELDNVRKYFDFFMEHKDEFC